MAKAGYIKSKKLYIKADNCEKLGPLSHLLGPWDGFRVEAGQLYLDMMDLSIENHEHFPIKKK